ncbi:MAG TPA: lipid-A-disaccharide synthase N-terminal domain-containing protein [Ignavibacteriaceae bacterium]|nr:lipid-A-disaccharide synthase N-terminal domain-containing protein [Ignavibacteriaceae bacterium]
MEFIGVIGLLALAAGWVPQTIQTFKEKDCNINLGFLILNLVGSISLTTYALFLHDPVFIILNSMTSLGAFINLFYKLKAMNKVKV